MNKSESKYFNTAERMDRAFLELLDEKELPYITVKEICARAGVSRSTFYLHYETISDLVTECAEYLYAQLEARFEDGKPKVEARLRGSSAEEVSLLTPDYLIPYLSFIKEHDRLFRIAVENGDALRLDRTYQKICRHLITPAFDRLRVPECERGYIAAFYVHGLMAIVSEWLRKGCAEPVEDIASIMQQRIPTVVAK